MKTREELLTLFSEILDVDGKLRPVGILEENHKPHPFKVGKKHTDAAAKENEGVLTEEILERYRCYHKGCRRKYNMHTAEMTLMLSLNQDLLHSEANEQLMKIKDALLENKVAGVSFVENEVNDEHPKIYRFIPDSSLDKREGE